METSSARAHKQSTAQATIQQAPQADVSRKTRVRHVLEDSSGMDTDDHENWFAPNQFTKEANQQGVSL